MHNSTLSLSALRPAMTTASGPITARYTTAAFGLVGSVSVAMSYRDRRRGRHR